MPTSFARQIQQAQRILRAKKARTKKRKVHTTHAQKMHQQIYAFIKIFLTTRFANWSTGSYLCRGCSRGVSVFRLNTHWGPRIPTWSLFLCIRRSTFFVEVCLGSKKPVFVCPGTGLIDDFLRASTFKAVRGKPGSWVHQTSQRKCCFQFLCNCNPSNTRCPARYRREVAGGTRGKRPRGPLGRCWQAVCPRIGYLLGSSGKCKHTVLLPLHPRRCICSFNRKKQRANMCLW